MKLKKVMIPIALTGFVGMPVSAQLTEKQEKQIAKEAKKEAKKTVKRRLAGSSRRLLNGKAAHQDLYAAGRDRCRLSSEVYHRAGY